MIPYKWGETRRNGREGARLLRSNAAHPFVQRVRTEHVPVGHLAAVLVIRVTVSITVLGFESHVFYLMAPRLQSSDAGSSEMPKRSRKVLVTHRQEVSRSLVLRRDAYVIHLPSSLLTGVYHLPSSREGWVQHSRTL